MGISTSAQILQLRGHEAVERVVDHAFGGVLHRHHPIVGAFRFHLTEHFIDGGKRTGTRKMAELFDGRSLGVGTRRTEIGDRERLLEIQAAGNDLPEQPREFLIAQGPGILAPGCA